MASEAVQQLLDAYLEKDRAAKEARESKYRLEEKRKKREISKLYGEALQKIRELEASKAILTSYIIRLEQEKDRAKP